jgi:Cap4 SAVED domain
MDGLGFQIDQALPWFNHEQESPYVLIRVGADQARMWSNVLAVVVRRCYVPDATLEQRALALGVSQWVVLESKLPDPGSTMAGDFGEILVYVYQAAKELPNIAIGPRKWRLKQDRTKPAPHSDVVHFILPAWPTATTDDVIICSEVKTKSTAGNSVPIAEAIVDCAKDHTSRLARTLVWLRDRAIGEDFKDVNIDQLNRFINAIDFPPAIKRFCAVAVICNSLLETELATAPTEASPDYTVVVIAVPELKRTYSSVFAAVRETTRAGEPAQGGAT